MQNYILGNPDLTHSVPSAFINECSGYRIGHAWVTKDGKITQHAKSFGSNLDG